MRQRRPVLVGLLRSGAVSLIKVHQPRAGIHEGCGHADDVPFCCLVVRGHHREQIHEFPEKIDHAEMAVFRLNDAFTRSGYCSTELRFQSTSQPEDHF